MTVRVQKPGDPCRECDNGCQRFKFCNCCRWCCDVCKTYWGCEICWKGYFYRNVGPKECHPKGCSPENTKCTDINNCPCNCCEKERILQPAVFSPHSPTGELPNALPVVGDLHSDSSSDGDNHSITSTPFPPNPQAIAAVIVGIIVAIILLDLCIFRFPVGRNIRDFLVRKIPFCIAFYS